MEGDGGWAFAGGGVEADGDNNATVFNFNTVISSSSGGSLQSLIPFPPSDFLPASYSSYYLPTNSATTLHQHPTGPSPNLSFISSSSSSASPSGEHHRLTDYYYNIKYENQLGHPQSQYHYFNPYDSVQGQGQAQSFDFFSCTSLPGLRSPESPSDQKRLRPDLSLTNPQMFLQEPATRSFNFTPKDHPSGFGPDQALLNSQLARQRRRKISDKTRCIQKLMPWDKKMDRATTLEEAHKYVRFLQAQIKALQTMPTVSSSKGDACGVGGGEFEVLGMLNSQQLLEVLLNSPAAQSSLYARGLCVYSIEQLVLLKRLAERGSL